MALVFITLIFGGKIMIKQLSVNYLTAENKNLVDNMCGPISISRANAHMVHMGKKTSTSYYTLIS